MLRKLVYALISWLNKYAFDTETKQFQRADFVIPLVKTRPSGQK